MNRLEDFFSEKTKLPSPPTVALKIIEATRDEEATFADLAAIISYDPALSARVLKAANSSLYSIPREIDSLSQATSLIGLNALNNIALSFVIVEKFQIVPQEGFDLDLFWKRAITTAVAAEKLSQTVGAGSQDVFVMALLQNMGTLILFLSEPLIYTELLDEKRVSGKDIHQLEKERFGFDHAEVSALLLERWNFPAAMIGPIRSHHGDIEDADSTGLGSLLALADKIGSIYWGTRSGQRSGELYQQLQERYDMAAEDIRHLLDVVGENSREIMGLFQIKPGDMKPFSRIMQEANEELGRLNFSYEQVVLELKQARDNAEKMALELKQANDKLRELAYRDGLTGLYNHRFFQEVIEAELERAKRYRHPLSLLLLDIDHFKEINDSYGHPVGDKVLVGLANQLVSLVRRSDIVARYGGEEFAVIAPEIGMTGAKVLAQRLRRGVEQLKIDVAETQLTVTISVGLACTEMASLEMSRDAMISESDKALYRAKRAGRNRVVLAG